MGVWEQRALRPVCHLSLSGVYSRDTSPLPRAHTVLTYLMLKKLRSEMRVPRAPRATTGASKPTSTHLLLRSPARLSGDKATVGLRLGRRGPGHGGGMRAAAPSVSRIPDSGGSFVHLPRGPSAVFFRPAGAVGALASGAGGRRKGAPFGAAVGAGTRLPQPRGRGTRRRRRAPRAHGGTQPRAVAPAPRGRLTLQCSGAKGQDYVDS